MRVRQLTGRLAGQVVEMPHAVGEACLAAGTAALPDDEVRVRGLELAGGEETDGNAAQDYAAGADDDSYDSAVEIPEGWADLHHMTLRKLASKISGSPVESKTEAATIIEAHLSAESGEGDALEGDGGTAAEDGDGQ